MAKGTVLKSLLEHDGSFWTSLAPFRQTSLMFFGPAYPLFQRRSWRLGLVPSRRASGGRTLRCDRQGGDVQAISWSTITRMSLSADSGRRRKPRPYSSRSVRTL